MTSHEELMVWMGSNRPQLLAPDTDIATDIPPGWVHLAKKATEALDKWMPNADEEPIAKLRSIAVREGRLEVAVEQGDEEVRGVINAIRAMSGEICDRCAGKGDPVEDATGETGSRCRTCRSRGLRVCPRDWPVETVPDHPHLISPGQWTQDIRGGMTGADWDDSDWRNYGRLETVYAQPMAALMRAEDDVEAMRFWTGTPGWAGLLRALFVTLRPEQDERTDEPGHVPWRLRWMKDKWGSALEFDTLATEWREEQSVLSSAREMAMHPAYLRIIGMGERAIPLILEDLRKSPDHWFIALHAITGVNPVGARPVDRFPRRRFPGAAAPVRGLAHSGGGRRRIPKAGAQRVAALPDLFRVRRGLLRGPVRHPVPQAYPRAAVLGGGGAGVAAKGGGRRWLPGSERADGTADLRHDAGRARCRCGSVGARWHGASRRASRRR